MISFIASVVKIIYSPNQDSNLKKCQLVMSNFLISLYNLGDPFVQSLERLATSWMHQEHLKQTPLEDFLEHVANLMEK